MLDPAADNTDVYAWTASDAPNSITVASNWIPGQVPANGPNFFRFDDRARYYVNFDNNGDGVVDIAYRYEFETEHREPQLVPLRRAWRRRLRGSQPLADVRRHTRGVQEGQAEGHRDGRIRPRCAPAEHRSEDVPRLRGRLRAWRDRDPAWWRQGVRRPARGAVLRRPGATFDAINIRETARRATRAAARTISPVTTPRRSSCRSPRRT